MEHFTSVNWLAVVLATVASMALGMGWYMVLADRWVAATGKSRDELMGSGGSAAPFIWAAGCQLVMAYFIARLTPVVMSEVTWFTAALMGVHGWVGFIVTSMILNHRYQNQKWSLTAIDAGYLLGVVVVQGIVIGLFGPV
jgi:uncharacterized membrane protein YsdA (DUF1294 family)